MSIFALIHDKRLSLHLTHTEEYYVRTIQKTTRVTRLLQNAAVFNLGGTSPMCSCLSRQERGAGLVWRIRKFASCLCVRGEPSNVPWLCPDGGGLHPCLSMVGQGLRILPVRQAATPIDSPRYNAVDTRGKGHQGGHRLGDRGCWSFRFECSSVLRRSLTSNPILSEYHVHQCRMLWHQARTGIVCCASVATRFFCHLWV